jgi:spore maturation protein SpmB
MKKSMQQEIRFCEFCLEFCAGMSNGAAHGIEMGILNRKGLKSHDIHVSLTQSMSNETDTVRFEI